MQGRLFRDEAPPHFGVFTLTLETRGVHLIMLKTQIKSAKIPQATLLIYSTTLYVLTTLMAIVSCILYGIHLIQLRKLKFQKV